MPTPNQVRRKREDVAVTAKDLLAVPDGRITEDGLKINIDVGMPPPPKTRARRSGNG